MKKRIFIVFLSLFGGIFTLHAQQLNELPNSGNGQNPSAYCGIGTKQGTTLVPQYNLHLYGFDQWSASPVNDEPGQPLLPSISYGESVRFGMNNLFTGKGVDKGVEFRLSKKNFSITNQEHGGDIEINATGAKMLFQSNNNQINVGKVYTLYGNQFPTGQFNVFGGSKSGISILLTEDQAKYGLTVEAMPKSYALSLLDHVDGKQNFYAKTSGETYLRKLYIEPVNNLPTERVINVGQDYQNNPAFYVEADGDAVSKTLKFTNLTNYSEKAIHIPGDYGYDLFSLNRSGIMEAGRGTFRVFENNNAIEVRSVYYDEYDNLNYSVTGEGEVYAKKQQINSRNEDRALLVLNQSNTVNFLVKGSGEVFGRKFTTTLQNFPDYVFESNYKLMPLTELKSYISENKHLPNVPSAKEVEAKNGEVDLGEMNRLLLEKMEEMTLYILQLEERIKAVEEKK